MPKVATLSADLVANTSTFETDLKRADRALNSSQAQWGRALKTIDAQFGGLGGSVKGVAGELFSVKGAFAALIGTIGAGSIVAMAKEAVDTVGGLGELASQLGITTDTLQAFNYAATQVGLSSDEVQTAVARLTRTIGEAANGEKKAVDAFNALGVGVLDANDKVRSTEDVLRDVSDALANIDDPARRAAAAVDLFGKAGQKMLPFLENGSQGIDDLVARATALGLVFDRSVIAQADEASDNLATLSLVLSTQLNAALVELAPLLTAFADGMVRLSKETRLFFDSFRADEFKSLDALDEKLQGLANERDRLLQQQKDVGGTWLDGLFGADEARAKKLADVEREIEKIKSLIDVKMLIPETPDVPPIAHNPPASGGTHKRSAAEIQADALAKKIEDLEVQVNTFDLSEVDQQIADSLKGVDQGLPGAKDAVATLTTLIRLMGGMKDAAEASKAEIAEYDKIIADTGAAWQKRVADGKALTEAVQTPAEAYAAKIKELDVALAAHTITQETYNRQLDAAHDSYQEAARSSNVLRQAADQVAGGLSSGIAEAAVEAEDLNDTLKEVLKTLAKMAITTALNKGFEVLLDGIFGTSATGGPEGGLTLVGERGPELVDLPAGSYVTPAMTTPAALGEMVSRDAIGGPVDRSVTIGKIELNAAGGTREQNNDLVNQFAAKLPGVIDRAVDDRLNYQMRAGGLLNRQGRG